MAWQRWTFQSTAGTFTVPINPDSAKEPGVKKTVSEQATVGSETVIFGGADPVRTIEFGGKMLSNDHYDAFETLAAAGEEIIVTDDMGRSRTIYITEFTADRVRANNQQKRTYKVTALVL